MKSNKGFWITAGAAILAAVTLAAVLLAGRREASAQGNEQGGTLADALNGGSARDKYMTEEAAIIRRMKDEMLIREASGSAPIDFLKGMIPHREAEVSMAESYLKYGGESRELEDLARDIVTARKEELDQMNDLLKQYQESKETDEEKEALYLEDCSRIFGTEEDSSRRAGEDLDTIDQAFAWGMLRCHQMAADMARSILEHTEEGADGELRGLAETILESQEEEIRRMESLLSDKNTL